MGFDFVDDVERIVGKLPQGGISNLFNEMMNTGYFTNDLLDSIERGQRHFILFKASTLSPEETAAFWAWGFKNAKGRDAFTVSYIENKKEPEHLLYLGFANKEQAQAFHDEIAPGQLLISLDPETLKRNREAATYSAIQEETDSAALNRPALLKCQA